MAECAAKWPLVGSDIHNHSKGAEARLAMCVSVVRECCVCVKPMAVAGNSHRTVIPLIPSSCAMTPYGQLCWASIYKPCYTDACLNERERERHNTVRLGKKWTSLDSHSLSTCCMCANIQQTWTKTWTNKRGILKAHSRWTVSTNETGRMDAFKVTRLSSKIYV